MNISSLLFFLFFHSLSSLAMVTHKPCLFTQEQTINIWTNEEVKNALHRFRELAKCITPNGPALLNEAGQINERTNEVFTALQNGTSHYKNPEDLWYIFAFEEQNNQYTFAQMYNDIVQINHLRKVQIEKNFNEKMQVFFNCVLEQEKREDAYTRALDKLASLRIKHNKRNITHHNNICILEKQNLFWKNEPADVFTEPTYLKAFNQALLPTHSYFKAIQNNQKWIARGAIALLIIILCYTKQLFGPASIKFLLLKKHTLY